MWKCDEEKLNKDKNKNIPKNWKGDKTRTRKNRR